MSSIVLRWLLVGSDSAGDVGSGGVAPGARRTCAAGAVLTIDALQAVLAPMYAICCLLLRMTAVDGDAAAAQSGASTQTSADASVAGQILTEPAVCFTRLTLLMLADYALVLALSLYLYFRKPRLWALVLGLLLPVAGGVLLGVFLGSACATFHSGLFFPAVRLAGFGLALGRSALQALDLLYRALVHDEQWEADTAELDGDAAAAGGGARSEDERARDHHNRLAELAERATPARSRRQLAMQAARDRREARARAMSGVLDGGAQAGLPANLAQLQLARLPPARNVLLHRPASAPPLAEPPGPDDCCVICLAPFGPPAAAAPALSPSSALWSPDAHPPPSAPFLDVPHAEREAEAVASAARHAAERARMAADRDGSAGLAASSSSGPSSSSSSSLFDPHQRVFLPCAHSFHGACVGAWFATRRAKRLPQQCPTCRHVPDEHAEEMPAPAAAQQAHFSPAAGFLMHRGLIR